MTVFSQQEVTSTERQHLDDDAHGMEHPMIPSMASVKLDTNHKTKIIQVAA
ncbi:hypothetical protein [Pseudomonas fluorescens]|uniref:hypothetical protein n=1 Tax=Pseudomonas fluorescens TaxID=294 RepID=UPI0012D379A7|nr:hypothetical protein [Pseudomonas fluorescens]